MKVTVTTLRDDIFVLDVDENLELSNFLAFCEIESGIPAQEILIIFNGRPLLDHSISLGRHGIHDGDAVVLQHIRASSQSPDMSSSGILSTQRMDPSNVSNRKWEDDVSLSIPHA
ncbi:hypothetical protein QAD02_013461 [Eretmocerus hayati]|uniref:Uncharacterized protein n=1 Tax=Eretmocerus hayati TaxID=131215 RepID=A0ACC2P558_9HYME|nr:hypothetical protein QAD02_013461 [Eretmocerus hayati]